MTTENDPMVTWNPMTTVRNALRNSPWIVMAVALHLILITLATIYYTASHEAPESDGDIRIRPTAPRAAEAEKLVETRVVRQEIPLVRDDTQLTPIDEYTPSNEPPAPNDLVLGDPNAPEDAPPGLPPSSTAIGVGTKGIRGPRPSSLTRTHGPQFAGKGDPNGGGPKQSPIDLAVLDGLRWLARHQAEDGSWGAATLHDRCDPDSPCAPPGASFASTYDEGLTGLALLAYLGAGMTHESTAWFNDPARKNQKVVVGEVVKRGLLWLVARENSDGSFGKDRPFMYNQALATMALAEAYGMTHARIFREPAQRAVNYLQAAQRPSPTGQGLWGWRYASRQEIERFHQGDSLDESFRKEIFDADTSVTGWAVMALKSAQMSGLDVKTENLEGALAYVRWVSTADGMAGYIDPKGAGAKVTGPDDHFEYHPAGMSALSMCVRAFTAHDPDDAFLEPGAKRLVADLPRISKDKLSIDYYYWYYGSLAMFQFDGPDAPKKTNKYWGPWNKTAQAALLELQTTKVSNCHDGGWLVADRWCHSGGPIYATALNVLTLEVTYRYPNAFSVGRKSVSPEGQGAPAPQGVK